MALKIDQQTEDALTFRIAEGVRGVDQLFWGFSLLDFEWAKEVGANLPEALGDRLTKICGENGLVDFIHGQVQLKAEEEDGLDIVNMSALTEMVAFSDPIAASKVLVEELRGLPYTYRMAVPLPGSFSDMFHDFCQDMDIGIGISIIAGDRLASDYPLESGFERRDHRIQKTAEPAELTEPDAGTLYLVQMRGGYIGWQKESPVLADFKTSLRQFLGAALAVKALQKLPWINERKEAAYVVHRRDGNTELAHSESLPPALRDFYAEMGNPASARSKKKSDRDVESCKRKMDAIKSVFALNDDGRRLSVATIWYLRSHMSGDTLDALLESTIALEALLGGGNSEGTKLSSLLGNRCAYLIGLSLTDRQEILLNFTEIYTLRSKIVHEGHHRFTLKERSLLTYSRELCRRALVKEMLFSANSKK